MKLMVDIPDGAYSMIMNTAFTEDSEIMFKQNAEDRRKTLQLFATLDAIKDGKPYKEATLNEYEGHWHCDNCGLITKKIVSDIYDYTPRFCSRCGCYFSEIKKKGGDHETDS